jgi:UDP-glucose 4-epimerase
LNRILITGGAGFIGRKFVDYILKTTKAYIIIVDNLYNSTIDRIPNNERVNFINCSVLDVDKYSKYLQECDYIFHMACVQISKSSFVPQIDLDTNATSTLKILEYLKDNKTNLKRFVYTSSCSIYGQSKESPITENTPPNISSIYAATKYLGENYTNLYHKLFGIPVSIIRYSNVYGTGQIPDGKICGVIGKFIYESINKEPITIFGDGEHKRDYSFIDDVLLATYLVSKSENTLGETYNVSTNTNHSVNDIVSIIESNIGEVKKSYREPRIIDNIVSRLISYDKLKRDTGWTPNHSIHSGIEKTINNLKLQK